MKKLVAVIISLVIVLSLGVSAFAWNPGMFTSAVYPSPTADSRIRDIDLVKAGPQIFDFDPRHTDIAEDDNNESGVCKVEIYGIEEENPTTGAPVFPSLLCGMTVLSLAALYIKK